MDVRKYEIYFERCPRYLTSEQSERTSEISGSTRQKISYFQTSMYCSVYYIKNSPIAPQKWRRVS